MSLIDRDTDQTFYQGALNALAGALLRKDADHVIFLGAGASIDDQQQSDLPDGRTLSQELAKAAQIDWHETIPLSRIAFYYEAIRGRDDLNDFLRQRLQRRPAKAGERAKTARTLEHLVEILDIIKQRGKCTLVITTNYDELFEIAYENKFNQKAEVLIYRGGFDAADTTSKLLEGLDDEQNAKSWRPAEPISLFKMHGSITDARRNHLVITDEDYINFLVNAWSNSEIKRLPWFVEGLLVNSTILFVGYSLEDWNFRLFFKETGEKNARRKYAIQYLKPLPMADQVPRAKRTATTNFWQKKGVDIINSKADDFMKDLLDAVRSYQ